MKTEYFTFGTGQVHSIAGKTFDKDTIIKITAENPRQKMFDYFGADWAFNYDSYESLDVRKYWSKYEIYDLNKKEVIETHETEI